MTGFPITYSPPDPWADRPPRLCEAINNHEVTPNRRKDTGNDTAALDIYEPIPADALLDIARHVCVELQEDWLWGGVPAEEGSIWSAKGGFHPQQDKLDADPERAAEEQWAKLMEEMFLGAAYGGPDIGAAFPKECGCSLQYMYERLQWPPRIPSKKITPIMDPAYSLIVACQSLSTYGAVARGLQVPEDLGPGIPASQSAALLPLFHEETGEGKWYSSERSQVLLLGKQIDFGEITTQEAHNAKLVKSKAPEFGPGAVYTYNPLGHTKYVVATVPITDLLWKDGLPVTNDNGYVMDPMKAIKFLTDSDAQAQEANKIAQQVEMWMNPKLQGTGIQLDVPEITAMDEILDNASGGYVDTAAAAVGLATQVRVPLGAQLTGSHVSMVLRTLEAKGEPVVQLLDTSAHALPMPPATSDRFPGDSIMFKPVAGGRGIFAGEATTDIAGNAGSFVGLGTLPPLKNWPQVSEWLRMARPVGLARLVLTAPKPKLEENDIYFISKMIPTWSMASQQRNFSLARLLWSLRNTPYYESIQAYWVVYAPRGALADVMWEPGARYLRLKDMCAEAIRRDNEWKAKRTNNTAPKRERIVTGADMLPISILSHNDQGLALQVWRNHTMTAGGEGTPPKLMRSLFISTYFPPLDLLHKKATELQKAYMDEVNARKDRMKELDVEAGLAAQRGDRATVDRCNAEKDALWKKPFPEQAEFFDFIAHPLDDKYENPLTRVRDDPFDYHVAPNLAHLSYEELPELLR